MAAAGADVTVLDNSEKQLNQDKMIAERDGLTIHTVKGSMDDLSVFNDESFDVIVHRSNSVSNRNTTGLTKPEIRMPFLFNTRCASFHTGRTFSTKTLATGCTMRYTLSKEAWTI